MYHVITLMLFHAGNSPKIQTKLFNSDIAFLLRHKTSLQ